MYSQHPCSYLLAFSFRPPILLVSPAPLAETMKDKMILQLDTSVTRGAEMPVQFRILLEGEVRVAWQFPAQCISSTWKDASKCVSTGVLHAPLAEEAEEAATADSA